MTKRRIVVSVVSAIVLALIGVLVWPGVDFDNSTPTPVAEKAGQRPSALSQENTQQEAERQFAAIIATSGNFYNCAENAAAKAARDAYQLVPCGTETVQVRNNGNTAADLPLIVHAGEGGDNVVIANHGFVPADGGKPQPGWTLNWTSGEGSEFLQMYIEYKCMDEDGLCWAPSGRPNQNQQGEFEYVLSSGTVQVALVFFTTGQPAFAVPGEWWGKGTVSPLNRQY